MRPSIARTTRATGLAVIAAVIVACGTDDPASTDASTTPVAAAPAPSAAPAPAPVEAPAQATLGVTLLAPDGVVSTASELTAAELPPSASTSAELDADELPPNS